MTETSPNPDAIEAKRTVEALAAQAAEARLTNRRVKSSDKATAKSRGYANGKVDALTEAVATAIRRYWKTANGFAFELDNPKLGELKAEDAIRRHIWAQQAAENKQQAKQGL